MNFSRIGTISLLLCCFLTINVRVWTQDADQHYRSSLDYSEKGAYQQALHTIDKAIAIDSTKAEYFLQRASIEFHLGSYDNTIKDCYTTLRLKPDIPEVYMLRGKVCIVTKSYGPAILFFGKTLKYTDKNDLRFEAYLNRGNAYFLIQRYNDALNDFNEAFTIDNSSVDVLLPLSMTYLRLKNTDQAMTVLNRAIIVNPDYAPAYEVLGNMAYDDHDFPRAISAYEKLVTLEPEKINAYNFLAGLYLEINEYEKAQNAINNVLVIDPLEPNAYKIRGLIYLAQGDNEKGCNTLFRAMQLGYFEKYGYDLLDIYREKCEE